MDSGKEKREQGRARWTQRSRPWFDVKPRCLNTISEVRQKDAAAEGTSGRMFVRRAALVKKRAPEATKLFYPCVNPQ